MTMSTIILSEADLSKRSTAIRKVLSTLAPERQAPAVARALNGSTYTLAAFQGSKPDDHFRDWRFKSLNALYRAGFFEVWVPYTESKWKLEKCYLHLYETIRRPDPEEKEYLALHCDPQLYKLGAKFQYKCGPHIHPKAAHGPLSGAHIALNASNLNTIFASFDSLWTAFESAVIMIKKEILEAS